MYTLEDNQTYFYRFHSRFTVHGSSRSRGPRKLAFRRLIWNCTIGKRVDYVWEGTERPCFRQSS